MASIYPGLLDGYNNDAAVAVSCESMCTILPWDAQVLALLERLLPDIAILLDAGGHIGTKYRAFREQLHLDGRPLKWIVWDTPAAIRAGRKRAVADGLSQLSFVDTIGEAPAADLVLCSGLLQYLDIPFPELMGQLVAKPRHLILNKVATRDGRTVVMLERIGRAEAPYQVRDREEFVQGLDAMGYEIIEEWVLPELSHYINRRFGSSTSRGYYAKLKTVA
jgi:putative methyltransferase (TIGR04325 family)